MFFQVHHPTYAEDLSATSPRQTSWRPDKEILAENATLRKSVQDLNAFAHTKFMSPAGFNNGSLARDKQRMKKGLIFLSRFFKSDQRSQNRDDSESSGSEGVHTNTIISNTTDSRVRNGTENVRHVLLLSYQRSGSSIVGSLFGSDPSVFYVFEPLDSLYCAVFGTASGWNVPSDITTNSDGSPRYSGTYEF